MRNYKNTLSIKLWEEGDRPREKLMLHGKETLSNSELLSIIIGSGTKDESALSLAQRILQACENNLLMLGKLNIQEFKKFKGIGQVKAINIIAALELGRRRESSQPIEKQKITSSNDAFNILKVGMEDLRKEVFKILLLNRNHRVIRQVIISQGGIAGTVVDPKVVFKSALDQEASSIILCHNHPSGNLKPSQADIDITKKLIKSGTMLDIKVLDHLIISEHGYYSFADEGKL